MKPLMTIKTVVPEARRHELSITVSDRDLQVLIALLGSAQERFSLDMYKQVEAAMKQVGLRRKYRAAHDNGDRYGFTIALKESI